MPEGDAAGGGAGNNSSDFVRKLYKMLEDPSYSSVVRWGNEGDSFVVLENEKFTNTILPKHFKHSNFASFVRQLNKYDFHKVRQSDETGASPYGRQTWEFKHPEFRADRKDNLDNIRRKAPAPRKATAVDEPFPASQHVSAMQEQLFAMSQQIQALQEQCVNLTETNKLLVTEVATLQKASGVQRQSQQEVVNYLGGRQTSMHPEDEPAELRRARDLLSSVTPNHVADRELERLNNLYQTATSQAEAAGMLFPPAPAPSMLQTGMHDPMDMRHLVYPVGHDGGIDPFHSDHINKIPYAMPVTSPAANGNTSDGAQMAHNTSMWGRKKPCILLVEDDKTCARIGAKFLQQLECSVDVACVNKINGEPYKYDLIFMDIIMPNLDGVSATACVREVAPKIPIIAMTSNIRPEDVDTYFHWGMTSVLAKPFTRDGMQRTLRERLAHLLKDAPPDLMSPNTGSHVILGGSAMGIPGSIMGSSVSGKLVETPIPSPSTSNSYHSPGQMTHASPTVGSIDSAYAMGVGPAGVVTPKSAQRPNFAGGPVMGNQAMGRVPDGMSDERPEKRMRMYGPPGTFAQ